MDGVVLVYVVVCVVEIFEPDECKWKLIEGEENEKCME